MLRRLLPSSSALLGISNTNARVGAAQPTSASSPAPLLTVYPTCSSGTSSGMFAPTVTLLGNKGGTPKEKKSPYRIRRKSYGLHFKSHFLKTTDWYYCPLCSEPKKEGEWCRREDCRQIKP